MRETKEVRHGLEALNRPEVRLRSPHDRRRSAAYEGRGGQQLLLPRAPFCPGRHCLKRCSALDCTCAPCRMACCQRRARRTPDLIRAFEAPPIVQSSLFTTSTRSTS